MKQILKRYWHSFAYSTPARLIYANRTGVQAFWKCLCCSSAFLAYLICVKVPSGNAALKLK